MWARQQLNRMYGSARGLDAGFDDALPSRDLLKFLMRKVLQRSHAHVIGFRGSYVSHSARFYGRSKVDFARGVVIGDRVTIDARSLNGVSLGAATTVDVGAVLRASGVLRHLGLGIRVGSHTAIGLNNFLHGGGGIEIGDECLLGPNVTILSENHNFADPNVAIRAQGETREMVKIGDNVWIGAGATVLAGVTIGQGSIIASGAVVTKSVEPMSIYGGVPARKLRDR